MLGHGALQLAGPGGRPESVVGITISGVGLASVQPDVLGRMRIDAVPKPFTLVASGQLHLPVESRPLAHVERAWTATGPSGTRVVLAP
ncbi:hypothetical protein [Mycobacterium antarcticum]|uniref:hypothetical protein n=1 Tax=unclassified Mycolicibacterium TaxID=2636767 RepID=UPI0024E123C5|nr:MULTISPECIES: hypothetical protein [unclassified Mycolicibacterium]